MECSLLNQTMVTPWLSTSLPQLPVSSSNHLSKPFLLTQATPQVGGHCLQSTWAESFLASDPSKPLLSLLLKSALSPCTSHRPAITLVFNYLSILLTPSSVFWRKKKKALVLFSISTASLVPVISMDEWPSEFWGVFVCFFYLPLKEQILLTKILLST